MRSIYDRYITVCPQLMQRQDSDSIYRLYKPRLFFVWTCPVFVEKVQELFREKPPPFLMQVAIQSNHLHLTLQSNHFRLMWWRCSRPNQSIGQLESSPASPRSRHRLRQSWLMCAVPHSSDQNNGFAHGKDVQ